MAVVVPCSAPLSQAHCAAFKFGRANPAAQITPHKSKRAEEKPRAEARSYKKTGRWTRRTSPTSSTPSRAPRAASPPRARRRGRPWRSRGRRGGRGCPPRPSSRLLVAARFGSRFFFRALRFMRRNLRCRVGAPEFESCAVSLGQGSAARHNHSQVVYRACCRARQMSSAGHVARCAVWESRPGELNRVSRARLPRAILEPLEPPE